MNSENLPPPMNRGFDVHPSSTVPKQERPGSPLSHYTDRPPPSIWKQMKKFNQAFGQASYQDNKAPTIPILEETVKRQNVLLEWYQIQTNHIPPSSLAYDKTHTSLASAAPLLKAYDQRLATAENNLKEARTKIQILEDQNSRHSGEKCYQCLERKHETETLQIKMDQLIKDKERLQAANDSTPQAEQIKALKEMNASLSTQNLTLEGSLNDLVGKYETSIQTNKRLLDECDFLKKRHEDSESQLLELNRELERARRWIRSNEHIINDYEKCIDQLGLEKLLASNHIIKNQGIDNLLSTSVQQLMIELANFKINLTEKEKDCENLKADNSSLVKKFLLELELKKTEVDLTKARLNETIAMAERFQRENKEVYADAEKATKSTIFMEDHLKRLIRDRDNQIADIISKTSAELKATKEQYHSEKARLLVEMDELKKSKIELQVEIGHLLREKRKTELDLETAQKSYDLAKYHFRKDVEV